MERATEVNRIITNGNVSYLKIVWRIISDSVRQVDVSRMGKISSEIIRPIMYDLTTRLGWGLNRD